jgi:hypothetical protein
MAALSEWPIFCPAICLKNGRSIDLPGAILELAARPPVCSLFHAPRADKLPDHAQVAPQSPRSEARAPPSSIAGRTTTQLLLGALPASSPSPWASSRSRNSSPSSLVPLGRACRSGPSSARHRRRFSGRTATHGSPRAPVVSRCSPPPAISPTGRLRRPHADARHSYDSSRRRWGARAVGIEEAGAGRVRIARSARLFLGERAASPASPWASRPLAHN